MLTIDNEKIRNNIIKIAEQRGYPKESIAPFFRSSCEDITVFDLVLISRKLCVRPSAFLYNRDCNIKLDDENETFNHSDFEKAYAKNNGEYLASEYPYFARKILLFLMSNTIDEKSLYNDSVPSADKILASSLETMKKVWIRYGSEYNKSKSGIMYEKLDTFPVFESYEDCLGLDTKIKDFISVATELDFDAIRILDVDAVTLSEEKYFMNLYSTLPSCDKSDIWTYARMLVQNSPQTEAEKSSTTPNNKSHGSNRKSRKYERI